MIIDEDICKLLSAKEGLPLDFVAKEGYLIELLRNIIHTGITESMIFKGGTAINDIYLKEGYRFSEDVDFDYTGDNWHDTFKTLASEIPGFSAIESRKIIRGKVVQIDFLYTTAWGKKDRVRLDINIQPNTKTIEPIQKKEISSPFGGFGKVDINAYGLDDLLARKLVALESRVEGKDIYDVNNAINLANRKKLFGALKLLVVPSSNAEAAKFLSRTTEKLRHIDYKRVRNLTNPYIPLRNRPSDWKIFTDTLIIKLGRLLDEAKG